MTDHGFITEYLETFFDEVTPREFYRDVFPAGELEEKGVQEDGKYNAIALELVRRKSKDGMTTDVRRYTVTDDLDVLDTLQESENFVIVSPISYAGKARTSENARFLYAMAIDLDGVDDVQHITDLFHQIQKAEYLPEPSYVVASGSGLHLYYVFEQAVPCFADVSKAMAKLKNALTRKIWNKYVTTLWDKPQFQSLFQGFRMAGGITKDGKRTRAFRVGGKVTVEYLNDFVLEEDRVPAIRYKSKLTLEQARKKYPEWYEKRIVQGQKKGTWTCKRDLYDWWKRRIMYEASVGHRYFAVMCLAIYAKKSGISRDELEKDAFSLVERMDFLTTEEDNHFTAEDAMAALELYNDNYLTFPIDSIVKASDIPIEKNKRNFQKQEWHLEDARSKKQNMKRRGQAFKNPEGRPAGTGTKETIVRSWRAAHPEGTKADCIRDIHVDRKTVSKYWDMPERS